MRCVVLTVKLVDVAVHMYSGSNRVGTASIFGLEPVNGATGSRERRLT